MPLEPSTKLGPYEILAPLGAGGMGEVYRARDTKLNRDVALKVLPAAFAAEPDRMARFQREAQVLASLNHPHIAAIYGLEESGGVRALVMELVEGPTLADRIAQSPIPPEEALPLARQIAEAVEAAHERGVIHRDLKPANIKLTPDGKVKVLDFGLAKALSDDAASAADPAAHAMDSPTLSMAATRAGVILGTAAYMSPEQAKGKAVDRRADIWAFGVVLLEMLTGRPAYTGDTAAETLAAVLMKEPSLERLPASTSPALKKLLRRCLDKDPRRRLRDIGEARVAIEDILSGQSSAEPAAESAARPPRFPIPWIAATGLAAVAALILAVLYFGAPAPASHVAKLAMLPPEKSVFTSIAVSPDGRRIAFTATDSNGKTQLWLRPLDSLSAQPLAATDGATFPFWSPDSRFIGFFADGKLKKIEASGGPPVTLCDAGQGRGGAWNREGVIVFGGLSVPLSRVSSAGGEAKPLTSLDASRQDIDHRWPVFLPDGRHYLYLIRSGQPEHRGIYVGALDAKERTRILGDDSNPAYAATRTGGYLLFWRGGTLMAQPFDSSRLRLSGEPFPVAEKVGRNQILSLASFSVSGNGVLIYDSSGTGQEDQLVWFGRTGKRLGTVGEPGVHLSPALSPDEKQVAVEAPDPQTNTTDLWLIELARGISTRFTFDPNNDRYAVWSPDARRIVFASNREGAYDLYQKISSGAGKDELLLKTGQVKQPSDWSLDGRFLIFYQTEAKTRRDLWVLPMTGEPKPVPYLRTPFNEQNGVFSPDGKWIAYESDESGKYEVYVQPFPATGAKFQVSKSGGSIPKWRRDGKELFYLAADRKIMAVEVKLGATFQAKIPQPLFETRITNPFLRFAVTRDGQRFLIPTPLAEASSQPATIVLDWPAAIKK